MPAYNSNNPISSQGNYSNQGSLGHKKPKPKDESPGSLLYPTETILESQVYEGNAVVQKPLNSSFSYVAIATSSKEKENYFNVLDRETKKPVLNSQNNNLFYYTTLVFVKYLIIEVEEGYWGKWGYIPRTFNVVGVDAKGKNAICYSSSNPQNINDWLEKGAYVEELN